MTTAAEQVNAAREVVKRATLEIVSIKRRNLSLVQQRDLVIDILLQYRGQQLLRHGTFELRAEDWTAPQWEVLNGVISQLVQEQLAGPRTVQ